MFVSTVSYPHTSRVFCLGYELILAMPSGALFGNSVKNSVSCFRQYNYAPVKLAVVELIYSGSVGMRFAALETLWLDDNKLTDQTTFSTLAGLRRSVICSYIHVMSTQIEMHVTNLPPTESQQKFLLHIPRVYSHK